MKTFYKDSQVQLVVIPQWSVVYHRELYWDRYFSWLCFLILTKDISESILISFDDDRQMYTKIDDLTACNTLQQDLHHVYDWASANNMFFNAQKFYYVSFSLNKYSSLSNVYINTEYNIISPS